MTGEDISAAPVEEVAGYRRVLGESEARSRVSQGDL